MDEEYKNYYRLRNKLSIIDENIKNVKGKILEIETYTKKGSLLDKLINIKYKLVIYNFKNFDARKSSYTVIISIAIFLIVFVLNNKFSNIPLIVPTAICGLININLLSFIFSNILIYLPIKFVTDIVFKIKKRKNKNYTKSFYMILDNLLLEKKMVEADIRNITVNKFKQSDIFSNVKTCDKFNLEEFILEIEHDINSLNKKKRKKLFLKLNKILLENKENKSILSNYNNLYIDYKTYCDLVKLKTTIMYINNGNNMNKELKLKKLKKH